MLDLKSKDWKVYKFVLTNVIKKFLLCHQMTVVKCCLVNNILQQWSSLE